MGFRNFGDPFGEFGQPFGRPGADPSNNYLLYDRFITPLAGGSVNGTQAEPVGGTRMVTDTNSKLFITGGLASVAAGGVGSGNPGLWYPSMTRRNGLVLFWTFVQAINALEVGWDTAAAGSIAFCVRPIVATSTGVRDNGTAITVAAATTAGVTYKVALILRSVGGCYYFILGLGSTHFILIWISATSTADLLPGAAEVNAIDVYTFDDVKVPSVLYVPAPFAYDTFTRANGALGSTESTGADGQALTPLAWNFSVGIWTISTNKAIATPVLGSDVIVNGGFGADTDWTKGTGWVIAAGLATATLASANLTQTVAPLTAGKWYQIAYTVSAFAAGTVQAVVGGKSLPTHAANATYTEIALATTTAFLFTGAGFTGSLDNVSAKLLTTAELFATVLCANADVFIDVAITLVGATSGVPAGIVCNLDSVATPLNFIACYLDGVGNCVLVEFVAGVASIKFTIAITYSAGAVLRVVRNGTSCRVFYNSLVVNAGGTAMTANTNLNHGIFNPTALNSLDNATIFPVGTSGEFDGLNNL